MIKLELLSMPDCVHCAAAKEVIGRIKGDYPEMDVEVIDVTEHPDVAQKYMLMSSPGIVINGKLEFTGGVSEGALRAKLDKLRG